MKPPNGVSIWRAGRMMGSPDHIEDRTHVLPTLDRFLVLCVYFRDGRHK
jgi:hypothetical protein